MPRQRREVNVFLTYSTNSFVCQLVISCGGLISETRTTQNRHSDDLNWSFMEGPDLRIFLESGLRPARFFKLFFAAKNFPRSGLTGALFVFAPADRVRRGCSRWPADSLSFEPVTLEAGRSQMNHSVSCHSPAAPRPAGGKDLRLARQLRSNQKRSGWEPD